MLLIPGGKTIFVNQNSRFDGVKDCEDGSDECSGMFSFTEDTAKFSLRDQIVRHPILQILVWIVAMIALTGNILVMISTSKELWKDRKAESLGRLAKCNRSFVLHLSVADFMMGVSLFILAIEGAIMSNK